MTAPFRTGSPAVFITDHPDGMQVELTAVLRVRPDGDGWLVDTSAGTEWVDQRGEGARLVPLDAEMAVEFEERDVSRFVVRLRSTTWSVTSIGRSIGVASNGISVATRRIAIMGTSVQSARRDPHDRGSRCTAEGSEGDRL